MLNKMPLLRATLIWIAITAVALGLSMPAHAASWGTMTAYYKGQSRATMAGNFKNGSLAETPTCVCS